MAEIDPIRERREREEQERKNESLKKVMWILVAVAVLLAAGLAYIWFSKSSLVKDLNAEKDDLTQQMTAFHLTMHRSTASWTPPRKRSTS